MLKDKLINALFKSERLIKQENDVLPLGMRGELEVIVRDREGHILSYEKDHNQVTNLAKMQLVHLLTGEIGTADNIAYSTNNATKDFVLSQGTETTKVYQKYDSDSHTSTKNTAGNMLSGANYFSAYPTDPKTDHVSMTGLMPNYPTKMLFGTGIEASTEADLTLAYTNEGLETSSKAIINKINGFDANSTYDTGFFTNLKNPANYYSGSANKSRTLQPLTTAAITNETISATDTTITGAIKNCLITDSNADSDKFDTTARMAKGLYRGIGAPAYIYAKRTTDQFYIDSDEYAHYARRENSTSSYEEKLTYIVSLPAQTNISGVQSFNPYNGWILKNAGLFCDSKYMLRSVGTESSFLSDQIYKDSVSGMLLFKRNLSSPILKTEDISIDFIWNVYITI